jgi:hypothetical protein
MSKVSIKQTIGRAIIFSALLLACVANAEDGLQDVMREAGDTMLMMLPAMRTHDTAVLTPGAVQLSALFRRARPHFEEGSPATLAAFELLQARLADAIESPYKTRTSLAEAFELCAGCHVQDTRIAPAFGVSRLHALSEYEAGEFSYLTRDYPAAVVSFGRVVETSKDRRDRRNALDRILVMNIGIAPDLAAGLDVCEDLLASGHLNSEETRVVEGWLQVIRPLASDPDQRQSPLLHSTIPAMDRYLTREWPDFRQFVSMDGQQVYWVLIRAQLHKLLRENPSSPEVPRLLYWLSVSDRGLHYRFENSLSWRYLERCMTEYTAHPYARMCFEEYQLLMTVAFSGSGGVFLSPEGSEKIDRFRQLVFGN